MQKYYFILTFIIHYLRNIVYRYKFDLIVVYLNYFKLIILFTFLIVFFYF